MDSDVSKLDPREIPPEAITDALLRQALRHSSRPLADALPAALESGEKGPLQGPLMGLLIANLTEKGTRFTAEELPLLFETLAAAKGHEIQSLLLAHIDRIDAPGEKAAGFIEFLRASPSASHAEGAIQRLAKLGTPEAVEGLADLLRDGSENIPRRRLIRALGETGNAKAVGPLADAIARSEDPAERLAGLKALGVLGTAAATEAILSFASRGEDRGAIEVLRGLDAGKDRDIVPVLAESLLGRSHPGFQIAVLHKLGGIGNPRPERAPSASCSARSSAPSR